MKTSKPENLPVVLVAYRRPEHTKRVVEALRKLEANNIYIFCDAAKDDSAKADVEATRKIVETIDWTTPFIHHHPINQGLANNIRGAANLVLQKEEELVLLEDDCVPQPYFLQFMYDCLKKYETNSQVFGISGYTVQIPESIRNKYPHDIYFCPRIGSWGWATWKDRWQKHEIDLLALIKKCLEAGIDLSQGGTDIPENINHILNGGLPDVWTMHWLLSVYWNKGYFIYPTTSHINNIGMDGSGVHCGTTDRFQTDLASEPSLNLPDSIVLDEDIYSTFRSFYDTLNGDVRQSFSLLNQGLSSGQSTQTTPNELSLTPVNTRLEISRDMSKSIRNDKISVLHIIEEVSTGGASRAMLSLAKYSAKKSKFVHKVLSLNPPSDEGKELAKLVDVEVLHSKDILEINSFIEQADLVQLQWWNSPILNELINSDLPACRLLAWFHIGGHAIPQVLPKALIDFVDFAVPCSPYTARCPGIQAMAHEEKSSKVGLAYGAADFARLDNCSLVEHEGFNVTYVGTVSFVKMHPRFVAMSSPIDIPDLKIIVAGHGGAQPFLEKQAEALGSREKFDFMGYAKDIKEVLKKTDVFGYPLCEDTYAASEIIIQEVMYMGIPCVVFPYGGVKDLVVHNYTGLVVHSELEYKEAIEYLYHNPNERERIGRNAKEYAMQIFGSENAAIAMNEFYRSTLELPKKKRKYHGLLDSKDGSSMFVNSLGEYDDVFFRNRTAVDLETLLETDQKIMNASDVLTTTGIHAYNNQFKDDPFLYYWSGLTSIKRKDYEYAITELQKAIETGFEHPRLLRYTAYALEQLGYDKEAKEHIEQLEQMIPSFPEEHFRLDNQYSR